MTGLKLAGVVSSTECEYTDVFGEFVDWIIRLLRRTSRRLVCSESVGQKVGQ